MTTDDEVSCRDLHGRLHRVRLTGHSAYTSPGSLLQEQFVTGPNDLPFLRRFVPVEDGRRDPRLYDLLDNEIRMVAQLTRALGGVFGELPVLVGYNMDAEEPFVLLRPYAGQPAAEAVRGLDQDRKRQFQIGVLRALHLAGEAGVVHGALSLDALRWNGTVVQLVGFERAQRAGEPRRPGAGPRQPPERIQGGGPADPRDDIWSAGVLIRELVLGRQALTAPADLGGDPVRLRERLDGVFLPVEQRPTAADLLRRMHATAPVVRPADPLAGFADGYRMFDDACHQKGAPAPGAPAAEPPRTNGRRGWRRIFSNGYSPEAETR